MKVNSFAPNCVSRKVAKKEAEKILRLLNTEFPTIASTQIEGFDCAQKNVAVKQFIKKISDRIEKFVRDPAWKQHSKAGELGFYETFVKCIQEKKVGNCADRSKLYNLLGALNGFPSTNARMCIEEANGGFGGFIDHAIRILPINGQVVKNGKLRNMKDLLIIDPWLGFAEFAPKYEQMITSSYNRFFGINDGAKIHLDIFYPKEPKITSEVFEFFRKNFPQFFINK